MCAFIPRRPSARTERVTMRKRMPVVLGIGDRDARSDRVAGTKQGPEVGLKGDPKRSYYEVVPAAVAASATPTTNVAGN
jgi:hypothetical protein